MKWDQFTTDVCHKFEKDEHNQLLRSFFHIKQSTNVTKYIEQYSDILHQILVHDPTISSAVICNRFVDGLKREIHVVVMMQTYRFGYCELFGIVAGRSIARQSKQRDKMTRVFKPKQ